MSKYAVYDASRIYHLMRDEKHTYCGVRVFGSHADAAYRDDQSPSRILDGVPDGLRLCSHCSDESSVKKGGKK
jgi:hypothetical protein